MSGITSTFTGPRRKSLCPKAARPAAPCATYCYPTFDAFGSMLANRKRPESEMRVFLTDTVSGKVNKMSMCESTTDSPHTWNSRSLGSFDMEARDSADNCVPPIHSVSKSRFSTSDDVPTCVIFVSSILRFVICWHESSDCKQSSSVDVAIKPTSCRLGNLARSFVASRDMAVQLWFRCVSV